MTGLNLYLALGASDPGKTRPLGKSTSSPETTYLHLRILISYWYYKDVDLDKMFTEHFSPPYPNVFADSGAYSAYSMGGSVDVAAYAEWLHRWRKWFTVYANLDVKGDVEAGLRHQAYLESRGLTPLPVFHGGEPWSVLQDMIATYPYIALGGIAGGAAPAHSPSVMRFLIHAFRLAEHRSVFHGFGITNWEVLKAFRWYSVDSSSWGSGFRFGHVPLFDPAAGAWLKLNLGHPTSWFQHARLVRAYGFDPADFADRARNDRAKICAISALSYMRAEQWLRARHGTIGMPRREGADAGLNLYVADGSQSNLAMADRGLKLYLADSRTSPDLAYVPPYLSPSQESSRG